MKLTDLLTMSGGLCTTLMVVAILPTPLCAQAPLIDYHQHPFSPAAAALVLGKPNSPGIAARDLIALLIPQAFSTHSCCRPRTLGAKQAGRRSNIDTAPQGGERLDGAAGGAVSDGLRAFCSLNPLKPYALEE